MIVAVARLTLLIPDNHSLKGKRRVIRSLVEKVRHRFDAAIAEVEDMDLWQKAQLGVALVGNDGPLLEARIQQIMEFMENQHQAEIVASHVQLIFVEA